MSTALAGLIFARDRSILDEVWVGTSNPNTTHSSRPVSSVYALRLRWIKLAVAGAILAVGAGCLTGSAGSAPAPQSSFETKAKHAILMDADANLVLFEKEADQLVPPASMSKLMTLAVVFRELKAGHIKLEDQFKVSEHAWRTGGAPSGSSAMFAPLNSMVSVSDLVQ